MVRDRARENLREDAAEGIDGRWMSGVCDTDSFEAVWRDDLRGPLQRKVRGSEARAVDSIANLMHAHYSMTSVGVWEQKE